MKQIPSPAYAPQQSIGRSNWEQLEKDSKIFAKINKRLAAATLISS
jgi:hypothetical protein